MLARSLWDEFGTIGGGDVGVGIIEVIHFTSSSDSGSNLSEVFFNFDFNGG